MLIHSWETLEIMFLGLPTFGLSALSGYHKQLQPEPQGVIVIYYNELKKYDIRWRSRQMIMIHALLIDGPVTGGTNLSGGRA